MSADTTRAGLRQHWDDRYRTFSLDESGCLGAGPALSRMIYRAKEAGLTTALRRAGVTADRSFRVLDMACGFGYFAGFYAGAFPQASYTGVDISARAIQRARETATPSAEFFADDVVTWRHPAGTCFDVIQAIDVLQLLMDDASFDAAVANLARHLADAGVLLVPLVCADSAPDVGHPRIRSRAYFDRLVARLGLVVVDDERQALGARWHTVPRERRGDVLAFASVARRHGRAGLVSGRGERQSQGCISSFHKHRAGAEAQYQSNNKRR